MKNKIFISLLSLIVLIGLFSAIKEISNPYKYKLLASTEFIKESTSQKDSIILDVRTPEEYNVSHINNSINIDFNNQNFVTEINKLNKSKQYFVYCRSGNRSADAIKIMKENGFTNLVELKGGILSDSSVMNPVQMQTSTSIEGKQTAGLMYMREEEKLARDVYITLYKKWNITPFLNISASEQKHMDSVKMLLNNMNIEDPISDDTVGVFKNQDLQKLYKQLTDEGSKSPEDALKVGALIEELDIYDLERYKLDVTDQNIIMVYDNLISGSKNHLIAFNSQLSSRGIKYEPKYLTKTEFDKIISEQKQKGRNR